MTHLSSTLAEAILTFWFGPTTDTFENNEYSRRWFAGGDAFDNEIKTRFGDLVEKALQQTLTWEPLPRETLAMIILLDQFPRNIYRKQANAFAGDAQAQSLTIDGINNAIDLSLAPIERLFFYMPLMHSESLEHQSLCITQLQTLLNTAPKTLHDTFANSLRFSKQHYDIIHTYGRFPYRNAALGRNNTPEEIEFLKQGIHFGQG